jgi:hypothetical protein
MPQNWEEKCVICQEAITNPICPECLQKEIEQWLVDKNKSLVPKLRSYASVYRAFRHAGTGCIICGSDMKVCAHCYCKDIYELFSDELEDAEDFLFSFNFELNRESG